MITTHHAPGNFHLFGKNAVVYSMKAIAFATNILITATVA
jgi:mevalonate kinase